MYFLHISLAKVPADVEPFRPSHLQWVKKYVDEGLFLVASTKVNGLGGMIVAKSINKDFLLSIIAEDPYVANELVEYQIIEVEIKLTQPELEFLKGI